MQTTVQLNKFISLLSTSSDTNAGSDTLSYSNSPVKASFKKVKRYFRNSKYIPFSIVGIIILVIAIFAIKNVAGKSTDAATNSSSDGRVEVKKPIAQQVLNKEFSYPLKDQAGKEVSKFKYEVLSAELRDEIIVKGQKATSIKGRQFLIVNFKITNTYNKSIQINARDYIRLSVNNSSEKLAADIHNDPVEVQAISTKYTRVGFPINDTDNNLTLQVGEIDGKKEFIKLKLK